MATNEHVNLMAARLRYLFHHIFFPPQLPSEDDSCFDANAYMLKSFLVAIQEYQALQPEREKHIWNVPIRMLARYQQIFLNKTKTVDRELAAQLKSLETTDCWVFYVREQNAGIIAQRGERETFFSLFEISATSEAVTTTVGRLRRCFPHVSIAISNDRLLDPSFTGALSNMLAVLDSDAPIEVKPKSKKAKYKVIETRDTTDPRLVIELLAEMLLALGRPAQVRQFYKHTRDEVHWQDAFKPWRRSPMWMFLRITVQLSLNTQGTLEQGEQWYKSVMLFFMASVARQQLEWDVCSDSLSIMIARIQRRALKLELKHTPAWFEQVRQSTALIYRELRRRWDILEDGSAGCSVATSSSLSDATRQLNTRYTSLGLQTYLEQRTSIRTASLEQPPICDQVMRIPNKPGYFPTTSLLTNVSSTRQCRILLLDVELWVCEHLQSWVAANRDDSRTAETLAAAIHQYGETAMRQYSGSPEDYSRMLLTTMELWVALDNVAIQHLRLLQDYDPEIPSNLFESLLLQKQLEMDRLSQVEDYVDARRHDTQEDSVSVYPSMLRAFAETGCLAERYFDGCRDLQGLRLRIEQKAASDKEQKLSEYKSKQDTYEKLMARANTSECDYVNVEDDDGYQTSIHAHTCQRCASFQEAGRIAIEPLEAPLPVSDLEIKSVVFELQPPPLVKIWRDATRFIITEMCAQQTTDTYQGEMRFLNKYQALSSFMCSQNHRVTLASRTKPFAVAHYGRTHPITEINLETLFPPNGMTYGMCDFAQRRWMTSASNFPDALRQRCTFTLPTGPFAQLQHTLENTHHTCNEVLAAQASAPTELSLHEYYSFASLRSGHRLQLPNILRELISDNLNFARFEVYLLVLQAVWQIGPRDTRGVARETHSIANDQHFAEAFLQALENRLQHTAKNWKNAVAVLSFSMLAARMLSLNSLAAFRIACLGFLRHARMVTHRWLRSLQDLSRRDTAAAESATDTHHSAMLETALVCLLTFDVDPTQFGTVMERDEEVATFTECLVVIDECRGTCDASQSSRIRQLLDRSMRLAHSLESTLRSRITNGSSGLSQTIRYFWVHLSPSCTWSTPSGSSDSYLVSNVSPDSEVPPAIIHFDLLSGRLLVNGCPLSRLPSHYEEHPTYQRMFGATVIEVYPSTTGSSFKSRRKYCGYRLGFSLTTSGHFILQAEADDTTTYELIPPEVFDGELPVALVQDYAHWLDLRTGIIEWRPLEEAWTAASTHWRLEHRQGGARLLTRGTLTVMPLDSESARLVADLLAPVEAPSNVHTILDSSQNALKILLPRLGLEFILRSEDTRLESCQFRGMMIDADQSLGALTGLRNKLILTERHGSARVVIIPRGKVHIECCGDHVQVTIDTQGLRNVEYHVYQVDDVLHRLIGEPSLSSKLYRCYLHALTAHCLPDRLTRRTGTEEALEIIASPSMKSYCALDADQLDMLKCIESCSPQRQYYPSHLQRMQQIDWSSLPSLSQHPAFCIHVESLLAHAKSLNVFRELACDLPDLKRSRPFALVQKAQIRDSQLRASEYGLESHTADHDNDYGGRDGTQSAALLPLVFHTARLVDHWSTSLQACPNLLNEIQSWETLVHKQPMRHCTRLKFGFQWLEWDHNKLGQDWCSLVELISRASEAADKYKLLIALSTMCYSGRVSQDIIETLLAFATVPQLRGVTFELEVALNLTDGYVAQRSRVSNIVGARTKSSGLLPAHRTPRRSSESQRQWDRRRTQEFRNSGRRVRAAIVDALVEQWENNQVLTLAVPDAEHHVHIHQAVQDVESYFLSCDRNATFKGQIMEIQGHLDTLTAQIRSTSLPRPAQPVYVRPTRKRIVSWTDVMATPPPPPPRRRTLLFSRWLQTRARDDRDRARAEALVRDVDASASSQYENSYVQTMQESMRQLYSEAEEPQVVRLRDLERKAPQILCQRGTDANKTYQMLCTYIAAAISMLVLPLCATDISLRLSNSSIARLLASNGKYHLPRGWRRYLTEYCIMLSELQHARRLSAAVDRNSSLLQELIDVNHLHWDPNARPDWLIFELENNLMIRSKQLQVTHEIISPSSRSNSITQLNMGEGKSSVIVPLASVASADGETLARVIVLKPLADQMLNLLTEKLGGMLGRRVFYLPISRSLQLTTDDSRRLQRMFQECRDSGGVWLAQPEHVLSFHLMGIERSMSDVPATTTGILETNQWLLDNSKDILDESDEILSVRLDLIYAMGEQQDVDFAPERWKTIQELLELILKVAAAVSHTNPKGVQCCRANAPGVSRIQVISPEAASSILDQVVETIIDGGFRGLSQRKLQACFRADLWSFLRNSHSEPEPQERLGRLLDDEQTRKRLLLLHGLLAGGISMCVLERMRWRVNYGLDPTRSPLAVPYRAKDVPSPRSEFSHPDVAILVTCLSYYYGHLTNGQLVHIIEEMQKRDDGADEYAHWSGQIPTLPRSYRVLAGVNLQDPRFIETAAPLLRKSKPVIDCFLSEIVFPSAMKEFPWKLSSSGWDIAAVKHYPTTGFSGTNDSRFLLPSMIKQEDIPALKSTSANVIKKILRPENAFAVFPQPSERVCSDGARLLDAVIQLEPPVRVLLDVGAQVIDMTNHEISRAWLDKVTLSHVQAVVFFDDGNRLCVVDRGGTMTLLSSSPFARQLDKCLVYLDECHTRGTDLKLPLYYRAAVTLGPRLTKDKLVQACMRMRSLGSGQSIVFLSPYDVTVKILQCCDIQDVGEIDTRHVLRWAILETWSATKQDILQWATQKARYESQYQVYNARDRSVLTRVDAIRLLEREAQTVEQRYGTVLAEPDDASSLMRPCANDILRSKAHEFGLSSEQTSTYAEEQERELSPEVEQERETERPNLETPHIHAMHPDVLALVRFGTFNKASAAFVPAFQVFQQTTASALFAADEFAEHIWVSRDFIDTIEPLVPCNLDLFLKPVHWILRFRDSEKEGCVVLSPYEANKAMPDVLQYSAIELVVYSPRVSKTPRPFNEFSLGDVNHAWSQTNRRVDIFLGLFAGQLYLDSYQQYKDLCRFLGLLGTAVAESMIESSDGFVVPAWRARMDITWNSECTVQTSPVSFLRRLLTIRRKGFGFGRSHLGRLLSEEPMSRNDFAVDD